MRHPVPFDTHAYVKKLVAAGMPERQAEVQAEALVEIALGELATKDDLANAVGELKGDIAALRAELKGDIAALRAELKGDIAALRAEVKADLVTLAAQLRQEMKELELRLTVRTGAMLAAAVAIVVALVKLM